MRKKNGIDMVIMVVFEPRRARGADRGEGSGVHGLLLSHHRSLSQADQGKTRLLFYYVCTHTSTTKKQSKHPQM